jgi:hypothetical protein
MNIYRFIDSRDIQEYLQKLNYSFTTQEAAFLVYWCKTAVLEEKITAWREIINTMPNCSVAERPHLEAITDFHRFLLDYIDMLERDLRRFKEPEGCVYICDISRRNEPYGDLECGPFSDFDRCLSAGIREAAEEECTALRIIKRPMSPGKDSPREDYCILTPQGAVCQLDCNSYNDRDLDLSVAFEGMWFDFPTPFHAGDIVCSHRRPDEPVVLTDLCTWDAETYRREMSVSECSDNWLSNLDRVLAKIRVKGDTSGHSRRLSHKGLPDAGHTVPCLLPQILGAYRHLPPAKEGQPLLFADDLKQLLCLIALQLFLREEEHADAVFPLRAQRDARGRGCFHKKLMADL